MREMVLIPPFYLDCVVAIGGVDEENKFNCFGSGFFYGKYLNTEESGDKKYKIYLVSNRHVFKDVSMAFLRCNPKNILEPAQEFSLSLIDHEGNPQWFSHENNEIDIAVIPVNWQFALDQEIKVSYFTSDMHSSNRSTMNESGISEGDFVYVLGFPMGIVGQHRNAVIARSGSIARIGDTYSGQSHEYLLDTLVYPGNSGGPVINKPEIISITGTKSANQSNLIGIVKSYIPYQDIAVSKQTGRPRVIFEENSGLAAVHPVDYIDEIIDAITS